MLAQLWRGAMQHKIGKQGLEARLVDRRYGFAIVGQLEITQQLDVQKRHRKPPSSGKAAMIAAWMWRRFLRGLS
jgi:hypothetical protein